MVLVVWTDVSQHPSQRKATSPCINDPPRSTANSHHLGYDKHHPSGRNGLNSRNGYRSKTVVTDTSGEVTIEVPRDRDGSFEPKIAQPERYFNDTPLVRSTFCARERS